MIRTDQLIVAQTICKCIIAARNLQQHTDLWPIDNQITEHTQSAQFGWRCREKELIDLAGAICEAFAKADSTFVKDDFMCVAIPEKKYVLRP